MSSPLVRIGIIQDKPMVSFRPIGPAVLKSLEGEFTRHLSPGETVEVYASEQPLPGRWLLYLKEFKSRKDADSLVGTLAADELEAGVRQVGRRFEHEGKVISDNTAYWVFVEVGSEIEALSAKEKFEKRGFMPWIRFEQFYQPRGELLLKGADWQANVPIGVRVEPLEKDGLVEVDGVIVGIGFHWQHEEPQSFRGKMEFLVGKKGGVTVVNEVSIDDYLFSVNSSEMVNAMHIELLKAQTVVARGTVFATIGRHHYDDPFDLCADDHCQVYRGTTRERENSIRAVVETDGEVLTYNGEVCDTRFSKVCGGISESYESVWGEKHVSYLVPIIDAPTAEGVEFPADTEEKARKFIDSRPPAFCNLDSPDVPLYVGYARKYFRWEFTYTREELEGILKEKMGIDVGTLMDLVPLSRGASARIEKLKVVGTDGEVVLSPELRIRQALSKTTLYSSAFYVVFERNDEGIPIKITLRGAGWGHGVGLCQIGAAMMAEKGYTYREILFHYYPNTQLTSIYTGDGWKEPLGKGYKFCFEALNCYDVLECPFYLEREQKGYGNRCWEVLGTRCFGMVQDTWEKKKATCSKCWFYEQMGRLPIPSK